MTTAPAETIRAYLKQNNGTTQASVRHLLTTFAVEEADEQGRTRIEHELREAGIQVPQSLRGLDPDSSVALSLTQPDGPTDAATTSPMEFVGESAPADPPVRICRKCSAQNKTFEPDCPNCGASYMRGMKRFSKRTKVVVAVVPLALLLVGGGTATALKVQHDNRLEEKREAKAEAERKRQREARLQAQREREADAALEEVEVGMRKELVKSLEKSISKDAKNRVAEGLLDGPVLRATCESLSGGPEDPDAKKGRFECMAVTQENDDGTQEGYRFAASADYDSSTYRWHLGS